MRLGLLAGIGGNVARCLVLVRPRLGTNDARGLVSRCGHNWPPHKKIPMRAVPDFGSARHRQI
jgi:hypothetical protein